MRKTCLAMAVVLIFPFIVTGTSYSDFFVVPAGKRAIRTILVSPKSTAAESGTALLSALNGISGESSSTPYLIIVEPGEYNLGSTPLQMRSFVDIQGSGEGMTRIVGRTYLIESGVVQGKNDAELRFLTVENLGVPGGDCNAMYNDGASPSLVHVTLEASGAGKTEPCTIKVPVPR